jgi:hypothetical protein
VTTAPNTREAGAAGMAWLARTASGPAPVLRACEEGAPAAVAPQPHTRRGLEVPLCASLDAVTVLLPTGNPGPRARRSSAPRRW